MDWLLNHIELLSFPDDHRCILFSGRHGIMAQLVEKTNKNNIRATIRKLQTKKKKMVKTHITCTKFPYLGVHVRLNGLSSVNKLGFLHM